MRRPAIGQQGMPWPLPRCVAIRAARPRIAVKSMGWTQRRVGAFHLHGDQRSPATSGRGGKPHSADADEAAVRDRGFR